MKARVDEPVANIHSDPYGSKSAAPHCYSEVKKLRGFGMAGLHAEWQSPTCIVTCDLECTLKSHQVEGYKNRVWLLTRRERETLYRAEFTGELEHRQPAAETPDSLLAARWPSPRTTPLESGNGILMQERSPTDVNRLISGADCDSRKEG
jgi:hypothetical protein